MKVLPVCAVPFLVSLLPACGSPAGAGGSAEGENPDGGAGESAIDNEIPLGPNGVLGFNPSNFALQEGDRDQVDDLVVAGECELHSDAGTVSCADEDAYVFRNIAGEPYSLFLFESLEVAAGGILRTAGSKFPIVAVLDDLTIEGGIEVVPGTAGGEAPIFAPSGAVGAGADGGNHCGLGGWGEFNPAVSPAPEGFHTLIPLTGGGAGVDGPATLGAGLGGGALELVAGGSFWLKSGGYVTAPGGPGRAASDETGWPGGGGAGGGILIEANDVVLQGTLAANGGGGGGQAPGTDGEQGKTGTAPALGGVGPDGFGNGGDGSSSTEIDGKDAALNGGAFEGGGGGGAGRIRVNSPSGEINFSGAIVSPAPQTGCATFGKLG